MDFKKIFGKIGLGDKDIDIKQEPVIPLREPKGSSRSGSRTTEPRAADSMRGLAEISDFPPKADQPLAGTVETEEELVDTHATRRRLFESKIIKVVGLVAGLNATVYSKTLEQYQPSTQTEQYKKEYSELSKKLGPQFDSFLFQIETYKAQKERTSENIHIEVGDFEEVGVSNEAIMAYLLACFPKEWLDNVRGIVRVPDDLDISEELGLKSENGHGKAKALAQVEKRGEIGGSTIVFSKELGSFFSAISHELGHANDWLGRTDLPDEYRIRLLYNVVKRVESPDRFKSAYVESINNKDPFKQLMYKVTEYFAEVIGFYLDHPKEAKTKLAPADLMLIENYLEVTAPNFDVAKAAIARKAREKIMKQGIFEKQFKIEVAKNHLGNGEALLDTIKEWSTVESTAADIKDGSVPDEPDEAGDYEEAKNNEEIILNDIFSHGNKKWLKINQAFMDSLGMIDSLAYLYKYATGDQWQERTIESDVEMYQERIKKVEKEMKKFSPAEQLKIKKFHEYLEKALRAAEILPTSVAPEQYYK